MRIFLLSKTTLAIVIFLVLNIFGNHISNAIKINNNNNNDLIDNSINSQEKLIDINPSIQSLSSVDLSEKIINFYSNYPRFNSHLQKINNTFLPKNQTYLESIALTGFPFELIIVFTIISTIVILLIKSFIELHKWRKLRTNSNYNYLLINPNSKNSYDYNKRKLYSFKYLFSTITTIILLLAICSILFVSIFVNKDLDQAITLSIDNLESHLSNRVDIEDRLIEECRPVTRIPYDAIEIVSTTKQILNITQESKEYINKYEFIRYQSIFILILILFGLIALGMLSVIVRLKWSILLFIGSGVLIVCGVWLVPSTHVPIGVVISDICPNMDTIINDFAPESINPYVYFFINCTGADNFDFIYGMLDDKIETTRISLIRAKSHHYSKVTIDKLQSKLDNLLDLSRDAKDILNCKITQNTYKSTQQLICVDIINSSFILSILFIFIGILLSLTFITSLLLLSSNSRPSPYCTDSAPYGYPPKQGAFKGIIKSKNININSEDSSSSPLLSSSSLSDNEDDDTEQSSIASPFSTPTNASVNNRDYII